MSEFGVEELEQLRDRVSQLSERQAANTRRMFEGIEKARREAREQGRNLVVRNAAQLPREAAGTNTPTFTTIGWNGNATAHSPGTHNLTVTYLNPDPEIYRAVYFHGSSGYTGYMFELLLCSIANALG
jgi:TolA-binding protein